MSNATAAIPETTHLAIKVKVRPGKEAEFDDALTRFVHQTTDYRGVTGVHLQRPLAGDGSREFGIVRSFSSPAHCREFYATDYYKEYEAATASLRDGDIDFRPVQGIEALFRPAAAAPPRWKMAMVTWLGVFPASLLWSRLVAQVGHVPPGAGHRGRHHARRRHGCLVCDANAHEIAAPLAS